MAFITCIMFGRTLLPRLLGGLEHKVCCGSRHTRSSMPVVLMSGYPGGTAGEAALAIGADEVLQKPLSARDLATSLARV
jgi:CheY-like chemotaxis protein